MNKGEGLQVQVEDVQSSVRCRQCRSTAARMIWFVLVASLGLAQRAVLTRLALAVLKARRCCGAEVNIC